MKFALPERVSFQNVRFLNDKIDLAQAEAIADLIAADSEQAARAATRSMQGEFSTVIHQLVEDLIGLRIYVESALDFPEEEIDFLADDAIAEQLRPGKTKTKRCKKICTARSTIKRRYDRRHRGKTECG